MRQIWKHQMTSELERLADEMKARDAAECRAAAAEYSAGGELPMTMLDRVLAMVLSRAPRVPGASEEAHCRALMQRHERARLLWLEDFGSLPV